MRTLLGSFAVEAKKAAAHKANYPPSQMCSFKFISFHSFPTPQIFQRSMLSYLFVCWGKGKYTHRQCEKLTGSGVLLVFHALVAQCCPRVPQHRWHEDGEPHFCSVLPEELGDAGKGEGSMCSANLNHISLQLRCTHIQLPCMLHILLSHDLQQLWIDPSQPLQSFLQRDKLAYWNNKILGHMEGFRTPPVYTLLLKQGNWDPVRQVPAFTSWSALLNLCWEWPLPGSHPLTLEFHSFSTFSHLGFDTFWPLVWLYLFQLSIIKCQVYIYNMAISSLVFPLAFIVLSTSRLYFYAHGSAANQDFL